MKIARVSYNDQEYYCEIIENDLFKTNITRNDLGIESYFYNKHELGEKLTEVNNENLDWLPPVARPGKIICIGKNYLAHAKEGGGGAEKAPLLFSKYSTSLLGHMSKVPYPPHTENFDYEVELAVIIGNKASRIKNEDDPLDYVFGYTIANDLTARDVQKSEKQWTRGKAFDNSLPIGPFIRTGVYPSDQDIWLSVNGEQRQLSNTSKMIYNIPYLIRYISQVITLEPGDILLTGTPEGVGYYADPKTVLQSGDIIRCGITGIGELGFSII